MKINKGLVILSTVCAFASIAINSIVIVKSQEEINEINERIKLMDEIQDNE